MANTGGRQEPGHVRPVELRPDVPELFIDDFRNVTLHDFVIRMNLTANYPNLEADKADMESFLVGRLAIPLPAFLRFYEAFGNIIKDLEARGLIARSEEEAKP